MVTKVRQHFSYVSLSFVVLRSTISSSSLEPASAHCSCFLRNTGFSESTYTHIATHTSPLAHTEMSAAFLPEVPSHIRPVLIIKGSRVGVDPLSVELRVGDPLICSSGFV